MSDWIIPILIIVGAVIIAVLMRKQSAEYLKSDNKQKSPKQLYEQLKLRLSKKSPSHHPTPLESALVDHSQSSEQPQGSETNKTTQNWADIIRKHTPSVKVTIEHQPRDRVKLPRIQVGRPRKVRISPRTPRITPKTPRLRDVPGMPGVVESGRGKSRRRHLRLY